MPIVRESKFQAPYLVYDAPINEKTRQIREMFDVDPETGYPRHYNWRTLAKLGKEYKPEEAFEKLLPFKEEHMYSTYIFSAMASVLLASCVQAGYNFHKARHIFSRPWIFFGALTAWGSIGAFICWHTPKRQNMENSIYIDYLKSHPDRFETVKRYKNREVLLPIALPRF